MKRHPVTAFIGLVLVTGLLLPACATAPPPGAAARPATPREVFLNKCSKCHSAGKAYAIIHRRDLWDAQVAVCTSHDPSWIKDADMKAIIAYYEDHPQVLARVFNRSCGDCHQWAKLRELHKSGTQWESIISFMGGMSGTMMSRDEAELLCGGLTDP